MSRAPVRFELIHTEPLEPILRFTPGPLGTHCLHHTPCGFFLFMLIALININN
jgi:hypothetical protein